MDRVALPSCSDCPAFLYCGKSGMDINGIKTETARNNTMEDDA